MRLEAVFSSEDEGGGRERVGSDGEGEFPGECCPATTPKAEAASPALNLAPLTAQR